MHRSLTSHRNLGELPQTLTVKRRKHVQQQFGISNTTLHKRVNQGLIPPPISLYGGRAVGWLAHECDIVLAAWVAEKPKEYIQTLVTHLIDTRQSFLEEK